jgi:hypothetical protein
MLPSSDLFTVDCFPLEKFIMATSEYPVWLHVIMLSIKFSCCYAMGHYAECHYVECCYAECHRAYSLSSNCLAYSDFVRGGHCQLQVD